MLVTGCADQHIRLWDASTGKLVKVLSAGKDQRVAGMAVSPDGKTLAVAGDKIVTGMAYWAGFPQERKNSRSFLMNFGRSRGQAVCVTSTSTARPQAMPQDCLSTNRSWARTSDWCSERTVTF